MEALHDFQPIEPSQPVAVRISKQILAAISAGAFPVGTKLPSEVELARRFGVSRPSIREALSALQFAGYVDSLRGSGTVVVSSDGTLAAGRETVDEVNAGDVLSLLTARVVIEPQVAAVAALDPEPAAVKLAESLVIGMRMAANEPWLGAMTDLEIHRAFAGACRNRFLAEASLHLIALSASPALREARARAWSSPDLPGLWVRDHEKVLAAIQARDPNAAAAALRRHLRSSAQNVLAAFPDMAPDGAASLGSTGPWTEPSVEERRTPPPPPAPRQGPASAPPPAPRQGPAPLPAPRQGPASAPPPAPRQGPASTPPPAPRHGPASAPPRVVVPGPRHTTVTATKRAPEGDRR